MCNLELNAYLSCDGKLFDVSLKESRYEGALNDVGT